MEGMLVLACWHLCWCWCWCWCMPQDWQSLGSCGCWGCQGWGSCGCIPVLVPVLVHAGACLGAGTSAGTGGGVGVGVGVDACAHAGVGAGTGTGTLLLLVHLCGCPEMLPSSICMPALQIVVVVVVVCPCGSTGCLGTSLLSSSLSDPVGDPGHCWLCHLFASWSSVVVGPGGNGCHCHHLVGWRGL